MATLLRLDASSRGQASVSRAMADYFVTHWRQFNPDGEIVVRDLVKNPLPHIAEDTISGFYQDKAEHDDRMKSATVLSDELIKELKGTDVLLIDTPMYNFSVPSALKAWIDQIVRSGETFQYSPEDGFSGLVSIKQCYVITVSGAVFSTDNMQAMDFLKPYLQLLLNFLGIINVEFITLEGSTLDAMAFERSQEEARKAIDNLGLGL